MSARRKTTTHGRRRSCQRRAKTPKRRVRTSSSAFANKLGPRMCVEIGVSWVLALHCAREDTIELFCSFDSAQRSLRSSNQGVSVFCHSKTTTKSVFFKIVVHTTCGALANARLFVSELYRTISSSCIREKKGEKSGANNMRIEK